MKNSRLVKQYGERIGLALALGLVIATVFATPLGTFLHRLGIDFMLPARHNIFGPLFKPEQSAVSVVVVDEETYRTPPFSNTPQVAWTPMLAKVLEQVDKAGAKVIGLDLIYPTTLDTKALLPGFDRPLNLVFFKIGRAGRLVLGETQLSKQILRPYRGQILAVGGPKNLRSLNIMVDADGVVRRHPVSFALKDSSKTILSFAAELVSRAGLKPPKENFLINYNTGSNDIPTYSMADLFRCAEAGKSDFFKRAFKDKIVIFGSALDIEDRQIASKRFINQSDPNFKPDRCVIPYDPSRFGQIVDRRSMPGIFIHSAAVNTMVRNNALRMPTAGANFAMISGTAIILAMLFFMLSPPAGLIALLLTFALFGGLSVRSFQLGVVMPYLSIAVTALVTYSVSYAYRAVIEGKAKRRIQKAFGRFLAPSLVDKLAEDGDELELGGEERVVTIMFSDIVGYTPFAENLSDEPEKLVRILNRYFTVLTEIIETHDGYVVTFLGDAVMSVWGAPLHDQRAEHNAIETALICRDKLSDFNRDVIEGEYGLPAIGTRFGRMAGTALVGNTGSATRLNYTATGDTTNLAARLEGANKIYGTSLMIGDETAQKIRGDYVLRRLDRLVVKGKTKPIKVYEVIGRAGEVTDEKRGEIKAFHHAMALYNLRRFTEAREEFEKLEINDPVAAVYIERCGHFEETPPPLNWDRSFVSETK